MYFPASVYARALEDYARVMRKNPSSVKSYMARNPDWAIEVACIFLDRFADIKTNQYPEMKRGVR